MVQGSHDFSESQFLADFILSHTENWLWVPPSWDLDSNLRVSSSWDTASILNTELEVSFCTLETNTQQKIRFLLRQKETMDAA